MIFSSFSVKDKALCFILVAGAISAGIVNGVLGTGGGTVIFLLLSGLCGIKDSEKCLVTAMLIILPLSVISLFTYDTEAVLLSDNLPYVIIPSAIGGIFGAVLGEKIKPVWLSRIFAVLIIWSGIRALFFT